jgi:hypothetical protein
MPIIWSIPSHLIPLQGKNSFKLTVRSWYEISVCCDIHWESECERANLSWDIFNPLYRTHATDSVSISTTEISQPQNKTEGRELQEKDSTGFVNVLPCMELVPCASSELSAFCAFSAKDPPHPIADESRASTSEVVRQQTSHGLFERGGGQRVF